VLQHSTVSHSRLFSVRPVLIVFYPCVCAQVLRVIFSYKRIVSLDGWLDHMLLPYGVNDFINVLVGDFRSNFDLAGAVANRVTSLSESFACSVSHHVL
jgi:hypothetical protein